MDPYKVLGVTPQTSDDDVKRAYRELARKYHPDNYVNNPLADLAETRMKEINEAYDMIHERTQESGGRQQPDSSRAMAAHTTDSSTAAISSAPTPVRMLRCTVRCGRPSIRATFGMAEALLQRAAGRDAEVVLSDRHGILPQRAGTMRPPARTRRRVRWTRSNAEYQHGAAESPSVRRLRRLPDAGDKHVRLLVQTLICNCCLNMCCGGGGC